MSADSEHEGLQGCSSRIWCKDVCPCVPARYVLAMVSCLGFINVYILRVNLSVAIVQMDVTTASITNTSARVSALAFATVENPE